MKPTFDKKAPKREMNQDKLDKVSGGVKVNPGDITRGPGHGAGVE